MGLGSQVGSDLLAVPFPQMVLQLALAISQGQAALDRTSIQTARELSRARFDVLTEIADVIEPVPPPARLVPRTVTVDTLQTPARVTIA